ncbi:MAG: hypothetical protein AB7O52_15530 [Planctomycetota bacterium]
MTADSRESLAVPRPRLVLRLAFAGRRWAAPSDDDASVGSMPPAPENIAVLGQTLARVFGVIEEQLAGVAATPPSPETGRTRHSSYYSPQTPQLRLVTGLAEGADQLAADTFLAGRGDRVEREIAAVLPFSTAVYRESRLRDHHDAFDRTAAACSYIVELDGTHDKPHPDTVAARNRRSRAYRAQSAVLLRHADVLVALTDPEAETKAGGTLETVRAALELDLPVIFIDSRNGTVTPLEPTDDMASALAPGASPTGDPFETLGSWVVQIVAGAQPRAAQPRTGGHRSKKDHAKRLLDEYFAEPGSRPHQRSNLREKLWRWFSRQLEPRDLPAPQSDPPLAPFAIYRRRATELSRHYQGLYRGAFLLNYLLAVGAVLLAALSLVILGKSHSDTLEGVKVALRDGDEHSVENPATPDSTGTEAAAPPAPHTSSSGGPPWLLPTLLLLAGAKLAIVVFMQRNTHHANADGWNDRAVDTRYLAERLRAMNYLPRTGSFRPPAAAPPQYASRVVRQSAVDWLFEAIVRSVSPRSIDTARRPHSSVAQDHDVMILRPEPSETVSLIRDRWVNEQANYHDKTAHTMSRLESATDFLARALSLGVIVFVALDLLILVAEVFHVLPDPWSHRVAAAAPWLVFLAALLPAAIASLHGIRFQSECGRLAERSAVMRTILRGRDPKATPGGRWAEADRLAQRIATASADPTHDPGAWSAEVLRLSERVAHDFVQEVAEWSVLYAKEVAEL